MTTVLRARPLTVVELADLPTCDPHCPHAELARDTGWAVATEERFGWCGVQLCQDGATRGYLLLAAPGLAPLRGPYLSSRPSDDAAVLVRVWVAPGHRGHGLGRQLVQRASAAAHRAHLPAIEAIAGVDTGSCAVPPLHWLCRAGFTVTRSHPLHPRVRIDLDRTVRVPHLGAVLERIRAMVHGPQAPPQPTGRTTGRTARRTPRVDVSS